MTKDAFGGIAISDEFGGIPESQLDTDGFGGIPEPSSSNRGLDYLLSLGQGVVSVPESLVGLADIPTLGLAGKIAEKSGVKFRETKQILESAKSPEQQEANRKVKEAEGFWNTAQAAIQNPSTILSTVVESAPSMLGGGALSRGVVLPIARRFAPVITETLGKSAPLIAGSAGEGIVTSGSSAEQVRQENKSGLLTPQQSGLVVGSGAATALIGVLGGRLAKRLGAPDIDTLLSGGVSADEKKNVIRKVVGAALSSGIEGLEELGQSAQEMAAQNVSLGKPWNEGVAEASAMGMFAGLAMGGISGFVPGNKQAPDFNAVFDEIARRGLRPENAQRYYGPVNEPKIPVVLGPENQRVDIDNLKPIDPETMRRIEQTEIKEPDAVKEVVEQVIVPVERPSGDEVGAQPSTIVGGGVLGPTQIIQAPISPENLIANLETIAAKIVSPEGRLTPDENKLLGELSAREPEIHQAFLRRVKELRDSQGPASPINLSEVGAVPTPASNLPTPVPVIAKGATTEVIAPESPKAQEAVGKLDEDSNTFYEKTGSKSLGTYDPLSQPKSKVPKIKKPRVRTAAQEFDDLVSEYGEQYDWGTDLESSEQKSLAATGPQSGASITGRIKSGENAKRAAARALFDIGGNGNDPTSAEKAKMLPKLKEFIEEVRTADTFNDVDLPNYVPSGTDDPFANSPATPTAPLPKLRSGENQGDVFANQAEDFALVGEQGRDLEKAAQVKAKSERDAAEAKAIQDKQQQSLFSPPQPQVGAFPKEIAQRLLALSREAQTSGYGPRNESLRQDVLEAITGTRPPKSKSGAKAVESALSKHFGLDTSNMAGVEIEESIRERLQQIVNQEPIAKQSPVPTPTAGQPNASTILNTAKDVTLTVPEGATFIRVLTANGKRAIVPVSSFKKGNVLQGAGPFVSVEAGIKDRKGDFKPVTGEITATSVLPKTIKPDEGTTRYSKSDSGIDAAYMEAVNRGDYGNIIPLSRRFNESTEDILKSRGYVVANPISEQAATQAVLRALRTKTLPANIRFSNNPNDPAGTVRFLKGFLPQIELNLAKISSVKQLTEILHEELIHPLQQDPAYQSLIDTVRGLVTAADEQRQIEDGYSFEEAPEEAINEMVRRLADRNAFQRIIDWIIRQVKSRFRISLNKVEVARSAARMLLQEAIQNKVTQGSGERFSGGPGVKSKVFDDYFIVQSRLELTPEVHAASTQRAFELLSEAGFTDLEPIGHMWKLSPDAEQNQEYSGPGTFDREIEAKKLINILRRELSKGRESLSVLPHLVDSIRTQIASDTVTSISRPTRDELIALAQGERSLVGLSLGMSASNSADVVHVGRNVEQALQQEYDTSLGGGRIRELIREALEAFRSFLSPETIQATLDGHADAVEILNRILTLNLRDTGNRIARRVDARLKPKRNLTVKQKRAAALEAEAVNAIVEQAMQDTVDPVTGETLLGIKEPVPQGNRVLTPDEKLAEMTKPETQAKIQQAIEIAIASKELEAGIRATIDAEMDPEVKAQLRAEPELIDPSEEMIEAGMRRPEYAHWRKVRHDLLNYSPTTIKLVQDVIKGRFSGTRFKTPLPKPEDLKIDLMELAKSKDTEVERVLSVQLAAIESIMDLSRASAATKARVLETVRQEIESQVSAARKRARDPVLEMPMASSPGVPLTPEQTLQRLINTGIFSDERLNLPSVVERVSRKSVFRNLVPSVSNIVEQVFSTPFAKQSELADRFADTLADQLGVSPEQRAKAKEVFTSMFRNVFKEAKDKASAKFIDSLTPAEIIDRRKNPKSAWRIIEQGVNSASFNASEAMEQVADANGWKRLTPEIADQMRRWVEEMQNLSTVPDSWLARDTGAVGESDRLKVEWEMTHRQEMIDLKRKIETMWSRLTVPLNIKTGTPNVVQAAYEWSSAVLLLKFGFPPRQLIDVFFQGLIHGPTRSMQLAWDNVTRNVAAGKPAEAWSELSTALISGSKVQAKSYRQALASVRASLTGTPRTRNVDDLISRVALFERATQKMEEMVKEGKTAQASVLWLFTQVRWGRQIASALDSLSSIPATFQEMRQQAIAALRDNGHDRARAELLADSLMGDVQSDWMNAIETARAIAAVSGETKTESQLKQSATDIVEGMIYQRMRESRLPADDFESRNAINKEVWAWNRKEEGGPGGLIASSMRYASQLGENWWPAAIFGITIGRFSNAIANSVNIAASFTPAGYFPALFGVHESGVKKNVDEYGVAISGSNWYRTAEDRVQRKIWATIGSGLGTVAIGMVALGLISVRWAPPKDPKEREEWFKLHRPRTVEFNLPDGSFIPVSLTVGPLRPLAPYFAGAGAWKEKADAVAARQAALDAEALKTGIPAGKAAGLDAVDYLAVAAQAGLAALIGGRTATGLAGSLTDYGIPNVSKMAASPISAMTPPLPAYQEIMRAAGVYLDPKMATFFDYLVPMPSSSGVAVNMLGDKVDSDTAMRRTIQIATGGTYPLPISPDEARSNIAYASLFATGERPPSINPHKGYDFNGTFRPMSRDELARFTVERGKLLKQELINLGSVDAMSPEAAQTAVQTAIKSASRMALESVGVNTATALRTSQTGRRSTRRRSAGRVGFSSRRSRTSTRRFRSKRLAGNRYRRRSLKRSRRRFSYA